MPSIEVDGFRLIVNSRDERGHRPHVHVVRGRSKVVIMLDSTLALHRLHRMRRPDVVRARELVARHLDQLTEWWRT